MRKGNLPKDYGLDRKWQPRAQPPKKEVKRRQRKSREMRWRKQRRESETQEEARTKKDGRGREMQTHY